METGTLRPTLDMLSVSSCARPEVRGKFIYVGQEKLYIRGVTYGTFRPGEDGSEYHDAETVAGDFAAMAANGINAVRTYTVPPLWLLDLAQQRGLRVMVGLPWEQHVTFLDDPERTRSIEEQIRQGVRACAGHPAVLCYTIGNEVPSSIVRWHGKRRIERFLRRLYRCAKSEDPQGLVTYVNFPTTEYLDLPFVDFFCFNVYLENQERYESYLARLHNLAGDRPVVMAEIGLDSRRNGEEGQARSLGWQVRAAFASGCAGAFVFAWTDEWHRGGYDVEEWDFGLTTRDRCPKPALAVVRRAFQEVPFSDDVEAWPRISVVVCSYNGARTIRDCLEALTRLDYPDYEVIVVNDGSTDNTPAIAQEYPFQIISTPNRGLSNARNTGLGAANGDIVAYTDDDAYPDSHWLKYLAFAFMSTDHVGVGGPNLAPPGDGMIADCVANAPGGPVHVLLSDTEAEHIPGCNMAFRRTALRDIGGFDPRFRTAGDDVDVCWRLQARGWTLGFHPAALVWHHRRNSVLAYWRQQKGYGRAEALLEGKWPEKYNTAGHLSWAGRLYGKGLTQTLALQRPRIYHGTWGVAPFQSVYQPGPGLWRSLPLMPEWYLAIGVLAGLCALGALWPQLLLALPLLGLAVAAPVTQAVSSAGKPSFTSPPSSRLTGAGLRALTVLLHLLQPAARLSGRIRHGLTLWRRRGERGFLLPLPRNSAVWSETWRSPGEWLRTVEGTLRSQGGRALRGGDYDRWDLEVLGGLFGSVRMGMAIEEHGAGRQLVRLRWRPRLSATGVVGVVAVATLSILAAWDQAWVASGILGGVTGLLGLRAFLECGWAMANTSRALDRLTWELSDTFTKV